MPESPMEVVGELFLGHKNLKGHIYRAVEGNGQDPVGSGAGRPAGRVISDLVGRRVNNANLLFD